MKPYEEMSFQELAMLEQGTVVYQCDYGILKGAIMRNHSLYAYIGVSKWHNLAGVHYSGSTGSDGATITIINPDEIVDVHGGLIFSGDHGLLGEGYWWFGWDYGHYGDAMFDKYSDNPVLKKASLIAFAGGKEWLVPEVKQELEKAMQQLTEYIAGDKT
jgi:hypothetical protein